jgi:CheY-like chemotaxis protein
MTSRDAYAHPPRADVPFGRKRILWLDNDEGSVASYAALLRTQGYDVTLRTGLVAAEDELNAGHYDLLILDVMIPTESPEEEIKYPPKATNLGYEAGVTFFARNRARLQQERTVVFVFTVRSYLEEALRKVGILSENYERKDDVRTADAFLDRIASLIGPATEEA